MYKVRELDLVALSHPFLLGSQPCEDVQDPTFARSLVLHLLLLVETLLDFLIANYL